MRYEVVVQPVAEAELEEAYRYIWKDSPERAARWHVELLMMAETLSRMPQRCSLAPENDAFVEEIRQLLFGSYRLLFMILDEPREVHIRAHPTREAPPAIVFRWVEIPTVSSPERISSARQGHLLPWPATPAVSASCLLSTRVDSGASSGVS